MPTTAARRDNPKRMGLIAVPVIETSLKID
jgi:hypothetical protein